MSRLGKIKESAESFLNQYKTSSPATYAAAQQAVGGLLVLDGFVGIDSPFGQKKRSGILGSFIGIFVGIGLIIGMSFFINLTGLEKLTATTNATVTEVSQPVRASTDNNSSSSCTLRAMYVVNGTEYNQTSSSGSSSACGLTVGQTVQIKYDPSNPGAWGYDTDTAKIIFKIFPIVGALIAISSLITFIIRLLSIIFGWKILKSGRALAKTLPPETDLTTIKNEIRQNFTKQLFGLGETTV